MKSHKKEIITVAILMAAAVVIFAGILKPEATQTKKCSLIYIPKIRDNTNDFWTSVIPILIPIQKKNCRISQLPQIM